MVKVVVVIVIVHADECNLRLAERWTNLYSLPCTRSVAQRETFAKAKAEGRCAFIPYVTAGFPTRADTVPLLLALQQAGADIIEVNNTFGQTI
jgi:hypothetical protein